MLQHRLRQYAIASGYWINRHSYIKIGLITLAIIFAIVSLVISDRLVRQMALEERKKMEIWAGATQAMASNDYSQTMLLMTNILSANKTIPLILTSREGEILSYNNIDLPSRNPEKYLYEKLAEFRSAYPPIVIASYPEQYLYYSDSTLLRRLLWYPYIQLGVFLVILGISIVAIMSLKQADQSRIWEGLSRETAHQLGTPISSLLAWKELLSMSGVEQSIITEMGKDIHRLEVIADRFQKVGSSPKLETVPLTDIVKRSADYMRPRISSRVSISYSLEQSDQLWVSISDSLLAWVLENLIKNAVDAMDGEGRIHITCGQSARDAYIDIQDSGKGVARSKYETIFAPGYTTRTRGWGLGLSLARRIIQDYHRGRIFVKHSELGKGTTFRILLPLVKGGHDTLSIIPQE